MEYENKTTQTLINTVSMPAGYLDNIESGEDLFSAYCNIGPPQETQQKRSNVLEYFPKIQKRDTTRRDMRLQHELEASKVRRQEAVATATGYPTPEILHSEGSVGGYYLEGVDDVAILSIPDFGPTETSEFQDIVGKFTHDAADAGKKKLIIDLRGNGGGRLFLSYDVFKQVCNAV